MKATVAPRRQRARRRTQAGFTLIEVLIAGAVFVIGMVGLTFMQTASVRSNQDAYESMVATNFAKQWIDRIKRDALHWTEAGIPTPATYFGARTGPKSDTYFVPNPAAIDGSGLWPLDAFESTGINYHGFEVGQTDPLLPAPGVVARQDIYYCAAGRFFAAAANTSGQLTTMTARVTVWWIRKGSVEWNLWQAPYNYIADARASGCDAVNLNFDPFVDPTPANVRRVRLATALRYTPL